MNEPLKEGCSAFQYEKPATKELLFDVVVMQEDSETGEANNAEPAGEDLEEG